jgi:hypothetical protein
MTGPVIDADGDGTVSIAELSKLADEFLYGNAGVWQTGPRAELIMQRITEELARQKLAAETERMWTAAKADGAVDELAMLEDSSPRTAPIPSSTSTAWTTVNAPEVAVDELFTRVASLVRK